MMKRLFALLLALCCLGTAALAEGDVWSLYAQATDGSDYLLGSAIPCGEGMLLSVDGIVLDGMVLHAENRGATAHITHAAGLDSGALILYADGVSGTLPSASVETGDAVYVTAARGDGVVSAKGEIAATVTWRGQTCPLLHCTAELSFGAPVTDAQGGLIGLVGAFGQLAVTGDGLDDAALDEEGGIVQLYILTLLFAAVLERADGCLQSADIFNQQHSFTY